MPSPPTTSCSTCAASTRMSLDEATKILTVQSGATWHDIQNRLHPRFAVKAMQSTDIFTVGGSISVNAHGMDHQAGSVGRTVRAMRVMLPDGTVHSVSRTAGTGAVPAGRRRLRPVRHHPRCRARGHRQRGLPLRPRDHRLPGVPRLLQRANPRAIQTYRLMYGHLSTAPQSFLREMLVYTYQEVERAAVTRFRRSPRSRRRAAAAGVQPLEAGRRSAMRMKWWAEKHVEPWLESCPAGRIERLPGLAQRSDARLGAVPDEPPVGRDRHPPGIFRPARASWSRSSTACGGSRWRTAPTCSTLRFASSTGRTTSSPTRRPTCSPSSCT